MPIKGGHHVTDYWEIRVNIYVAVSYGIPIATQLELHFRVKSGASVLGKHIGVIWTLQQWFLFLSWIIIEHYIEIRHSIVQMHSRLFTFRYTLVQGWNFLHVRSNNITENVSSCCRRNDFCRKQKIAFQNNSLAPKPLNKIIQLFIFSEQMPLLYDTFFSTRNEDYTFSKMESPYLEKKKPVIW